jgi:hypothetical protein
MPHFLCRLEMIPRSPWPAREAHRLPLPWPRPAGVEARPQPHGFSIWAWHQEGCPEPKEVQTVASPYDWRAFATILNNNRWYSSLIPSPMPGSFNGDMLKLVSVTGENGVRADVLKVALLRLDYRGCQWLIAQSDQSLRTIASMTGDTLSARVPTLHDPFAYPIHPISVIAKVVDERGCDPDFLTLREPYCTRRALALRDLAILLEYEQAREHKSSNRAGPRVL